MTALIISVGTVVRTLPHPQFAGVDVDHDVPDLQLTARFGHVDPPTASCSKWVAYFNGGGAMALALIEPGLWWAVPTPGVDVAAELGHLGVTVKTLHSALMGDATLADKLVDHSSDMWREELEVEGDDTTGVIGIRGPGGGRRNALSGQDLGDEEVPKSPVLIHARVARKIPIPVEIE